MEDILVTTHCPVLGIPLEVNNGGTAGGDFSPSLDRIIPAFGYIPGNILVVSLRANRAKSNLTPDEMSRLAEFYTTIQERLYHG